MGYSERVKEEKRELDIKKEALSKFLKTELFLKLELESRKLLQRQFEVMSEYSEILEERLKLADNE